MTPVRAISWDRLVAAALVLMVAAVYWRVGSYPFINYDDPNIYGIPALKGGLSAGGIRWAFTNVKDIGWLPLTWLSHLLDISLFGMDAGKHHLVNALLHLINAQLLFLVLRKATGRLWESAIVAALFAVHPLHVESVAWVSERKDVLSTFFWMLTTWAYMHYSERPAPGRYGAVVLFMSLGLMSKPMLVTLPFVLLLFDIWPLKRLAPGVPGPTLCSLIVEKVPLFVLSAVFCVITYISQDRMGAVTPMGAASMMTRLGGAFSAYADYLVRMSWPARLSVFYPPEAGGPDPWKALGACLFILGLSVLAVREIRGRGWFATGWFWFLGTLVPVIGLVQVGSQATADRYTYVPLTGLFVLVVWGGNELAARMKIPPRLIAAVAAIWLLALMVSARVQVDNWRDSSTLFSHALSVTRDNWVAHNSLGMATAESGNHNQAVVHFREVIRIWPGYAEGHYNLGASLDRLGRGPEAVSHYREAVRFDPGHSLAHYNLAVDLNRSGRIAEAVGHYRAAIRSNPEFAEAHNNLAVCMADAGKFEDADAHYLEALRIRPDYAEARFNFGQSLSHRGMLPEAAEQFREAARLRPDYAEAFNALGVLLARQGAFPDAALRFREALRVRPDYEGARHNLDLALTAIDRDRR